MQHNADLTKQEIELIKEREQIAGQIMKVLEDVRAFKLGDFLIAFAQGRYDMNRRQLTNSYGAPRKFQVVAVDEHGIPYMKKLNKQGKASGQIVSPVRFADGERFERDNQYIFEVDPDYTDSIILQDEENYDATLIHKDKSETFKAITEHNKKCKIKCDDVKQIADFFDKNVVVGTVLYRSAKSHFTVLEIKPAPRDRANRLQATDPFIKIQDSKGKIKTLSVNSFRYTALYTVRPHTYGELKDPK